MVNLTRHSSSEMDMKKLCGQSLVAIVSSVVLVAMRLMLALLIRRSCEIYIHPHLSEFVLPINS